MAYKVLVLSTDHWMMIDEGSSLVTFHREEALQRLVQAALGRGVSVVFILPHDQLNRLVTASDAERDRVARRNDDYHTIQRALIEKLRQLGLDTGRVEVVSDQSYDEFYQMQKRLNTLPSKFQEGGVLPCLLHVSVNKRVQVGELLYVGWDNDHSNQVAIVNNQQSYPPKWRVRFVAMAIDSPMNVTDQFDDIDRVIACMDNPDMAVAASTGSVVSPATGLNQLTRRLRGTGALADSPSNRSHLARRIDVDMDVDRPDQPIKLVVLSLGDWVMWSTFGEVVFHGSPQRLEELIELIVETRRDVKIIIVPPINAVHKAASGVNFRALIDTLMDRLNAICARAGFDTDNVLVASYAEQHRYAETQYGSDFPESFPTNILRCIAYARRLYINTYSDNIVPNQVLFVTRSPRDNKEALKPQTRTENLFNSRLLLSNEDLQAIRVDLTASYVEPQPMPVEPTTPADRFRTNASGRVVRVDNDLRGETDMRREFPAMNLPPQHWYRHRGVIAYGVATVIFSSFAGLAGLVWSSNQPFNCERDVCQASVAAGCAYVMLIAAIGLGLLINPRFSAFLGPRAQMPRQPSLMAQARQYCFGSWALRGLEIGPRR